MLKEAADPFEMFNPTGIVNRSPSILHPPPPYNKHNINTVRLSNHHHKHTTQQLSMHIMAITNTIQTTLMTPLTFIQPTFHEFFLHSTKAYYTNINSHTVTITPK
jgi:hypothetical protein